MSWAGVMASLPLGVHVEYVWRAVWRSARPLLGGRCLSFFFRGDALDLQPSLECGVVGSRSDARAAFLAF